jgi:hypothetical protein
MIEWKYDRNGTAHASVDEAVLFVSSGWPDPEKPWAWLVKNKQLDPVENRWVFVDSSGSAATQVEAMKAAEAALES